RLGGAANVALNVQALGATPILCSVIGDDPEGTNFLDLLKKSSLTSEGIIKSPDRITTIKHRVMSGSHHMLRVDEEMDHDLNEIEFNRLLEIISSQVPYCDVIIFEDYDKGVLNKAIISKVISIARSHNVPTVVDPKKKNFLY